MSVAALPTDTPVKNVASRADKKHASAGDKPAADFRNLVKGEDRRESASVHHGKKARDDGQRAGDVSDARPRSIWARYGSVFDRPAGKIDAEVGTATDENRTVDETDWTDTGEAGEAIAVTSFADKIEVSVKAEEVTADMSAQEKAAAATMSAEDGLVAAAAESAPGEAKAATQGNGLAQMAALMGQRTDAPQPQAARPAISEQVPSGQQSSAPEIVVPTGDAGDGSASGESGNGRGQSHDDAASRFAQPQNGNRVAGVSVVSQQVTPAMPVQPAGMTETGAAFVDSLAEGVSRSERAELVGQSTLLQGGSRPGPVTSLRIQLQPADLGMVTARLSGTEAQLSIEITVDNAEARHRLASDSDSIVTALRGLGIEVDRITIQQSQPSSASTPNGSNRGNEFAQSGEGRGERGDQASRQDSERGRGNTQGGQGNAKPDASGGGVYI